MVGKPGTRSSQNSPNRSERTQGEGSVDKVYCVYILTNQRNTVRYTASPATSGHGCIGTGRTCFPDLQTATMCPSSSIMRRDTMRPGP